MFRKMERGINNTLLILDKLKTSVGPITLYLDGIEIKKRISFRLSNYPRNIYSLSTSLNILKILSYLISSTDALSWYYESRNQKNHYKFEGEGSLYIQAEEYYECSTMIDGINNDTYEAITPYWQGIDALGFEYSGQFFRRIQEEINSTIEDCIKVMIEDQVKKIQDEVSDSHNKQIIIITSVVSATFLTGLAIIAYRQRQNCSQNSYNRI